MTYEPMVNRLSPLVTPPLLSVPMVEDREAVGLAPACVEMSPLPSPEAWEELKLFGCLK